MLLLQFLPQDKVSEFARLKPDELLARTQQAIGDATLYNLHQQLIAARKELKGAEDVSPPAIWDCWQARCFHAVLLCCGMPCITTMTV